MGVINLLRRARRLSWMMPWSAAFRFACRYHRAPVVEFRLTPVGRSVFVRPRSSDLACLEQVFLGDQYNPPFPLDARVIVDAGANIGAASLYFSAKFPDARIFAIEPDQSNFELLQRNCAGLNNVLCIKAGLWPTATPLAFVDADAERWALSLKPAEANQAAVASLTIPELVDRHRIERIDILKIDIEGAEQELFSDTVGDWIDRVDTIVIELHDRFRAGCAQSFYAALYGRHFVHEIRGENTFIRLVNSGVECPG